MRWYKTDKSWLIYSCSLLGKGNEITQCFSDFCNKMFCEDCILKEIKPRLILEPVRTQPDIIVKSGKVLPLVREIRI